MLWEGWEYFYKMNKNTTCHESKAFVKKVHIRHFIHHDYDLPDNEVCVCYWEEKKRIKIYLGQGEVG